MQKAVFLLLLFHGAAGAQSSPFAAASIKPNNSGENVVSVRLVPGGSVRAMNPSLETVITTAWQIRVHRGTREMPVYALLVAKGGAKLPPAREECGDPKAGIPPPSPIARPCGGFNRAPDELLQSGRRIPS